MSLQMGGGGGGWWWLGMVVVVVAGGGGGGRGRFVVAGALTEGGRAWVLVTLFRCLGNC